MLKTRLLQISLLLIMFMFVSAAYARVYKWVDEDGRVQFGDRPPQNVEESDEVEIRKQKSSSAPVQVDRKQARDRLLQQYQKEREEKKAAAAQEREEKKQRQKRCAYAKDTLKQYLEHDRIYEPMPNQERRFLTDKERDAEIATARTEVKQWCK